MKCRCLLVVLTATLFSLLASRPATAQHVRFGLKAGANSAKWGYSADRRWGLNGGGVLRYSPSPERPWHLQAELLYSAKGLVWGRYRYANAIHLERERLHYLDLPLLGRYQAHNFFVEAGPQLSTVVGGKFDYGSYPDGEVQFRRSRYAAVQLGYAAGLGYELSNGLSLTLRYSSDLTGMYRSSVWGGVRNSVLQTQVGYLFGQRK